jgi:hypothetical protein
MTRIEPISISYTSIRDTPGDLDSHHPGHIAVTLNPLTLWVFTSTGWQAVGTPSGDAPPSPASESGAGVVELATQAEVEAGTAGILVATVARLQAELSRRLSLALTPGAWISPTLLSAWVNFGSTYDTAGYRKNALGTVELKGLVKDGSAGGNAIFVLPVGYRPSADKMFVSIRQGIGIARIDVRTSGAVEATDVGGFNGFLSLEGIRFSV